ncbi:killer cell lectin-like receptor subfamily G member 1 [Gopherus flavomarginatus]|uniref:killer cell lectin-like receptor subfamily G member 1 n=1 Tax=Gopherus flavomarginatus TaxID=286002 RepID=UPI0021CBF0AD|nr:killer cell lectin-like receptor subfamily G member 1 [Gopherus flavomarginatus]
MREQEVTYTEVKCHTSEQQRRQRPRNSESKEMRKKERIYMNTKCLTLPKQQLNQRPENEEIKGFPAPAPPWKIITVILGIFCLILLGVSVALAIKYHSCPGCPDQWVRYRDSCYYFSNVKKDWNSSRNFCSAQDSGLLVISDTREKNLFLGIRTEEYWIGLTNFNGSGWAWEDGSTFSDIKVTSNSPVQHWDVLLKGACQASSCAVPFPCIYEKSSK